MDCKETQEYISGYVDKELSNSEQKKVNEHIHLCDGCRADVEIETKVKEVVVSKKHIEHTPNKLRNLIIFELFSKNSRNPISKLLNFIRIKLGFNPSSLKKF
ncbi:MAG: zf-HC2 domain-containing protein [Ignavibacteria bacterium]|nr:zf-HC2 domain-containing protein [Ignavibacteria bacterium]